MEKLQTVLIFANKRENECKQGIAVVIKRSVLDFDCAPSGTPRDLQALLLCFVVLQIRM